LLLESVSFNFAALRDWGQTVDPNKLFKTLGGIAGLAGIAFGVLLLLFQGVLQQKFLPGTGLDTVQAYHVLMALMVLTFGLAAAGIVAWLIFAALPSGTPLPQHNVYILAVLLLAVLAATIGLGSGALDRSNPVLPQTAPTSTPAPSAKQEVTRSLRVCVGEYERACQPHDAYLYCGVDVNAWAKARCDRFKVQQLNDVGGNKCGYQLYEVLCTSAL
jgi:hypothetical protein